MSYSIHADLLAEQKKTAYEPSLSLTVQDNGLLHPTTRLVTTADTGLGTMVYTGSVFVRAYARNGVGIYVQRITSPSTASQWTTWTLLISGSQYVSPVLLWTGTYVVLVYADSSTSPNTVIRWRRSSDGGQTWSAAQTLLTSTYTLESGIAGISTDEVVGAGLSQAAIYYPGNSAGTLLARKFYKPASDTWDTTYTLDVSAWGKIRELSGVYLKGASASVQLALIMTDTATTLASDVYLARCGHHADLPHSFSVSASRRLRSLPASLTAAYEGVAFTRRSNSEAWLSVHLYRDASVSRLTRVSIVAKAEDAFSSAFDGGLFIEAAYKGLYVFCWEATGVTYAADLQGVWSSEAKATVAMDQGRIMTYTLNAAGPDLFLEVVLDNRDGSLTPLLTGYLGADVVFERGAVCSGTARRVAVGRMVLARIDSVSAGHVIEVRAYGYWRLLTLWRGDVGYTFEGELYDIIGQLLGLAGVRGFAYEGWDYALSEATEEPFVNVLDGVSLASGQSVASAIKSLQEQFQFVVRPSSDKAFTGYAFGFLQNGDLVAIFSDEYHHYWQVGSRESRRIPDSTYFIVAGEGVVADAGTEIRYEVGRQYTRLISKRYADTLAEINPLALSANSKADEEVEAGRFECLPDFRLQPFDKILYRDNERIVSKITERLDETGWRQVIELSDFGIDVAGGSSTGGGTEAITSKAIRGIVVSFNSTTWIAQVRLENSVSDSVPVACGQWLPASLLTAGASVAVLLFDESNPGDGLVVGPYGAAAPVIETALNIGLCQGRLTLASGTPVMTTNQTAKTTLYFSPYTGNRLALFDGSALWKYYHFLELSLSLSGLTANTIYDIFIYDNAGALTLEALAWSSGTARATALALQNGVWVKSGATTRRYLGTIRITGTTGQCEFSLSGTTPKAFVWNYYNRVNIGALVMRSVTSYTYATAAWRQWNADATFQLENIIGVVEEAATLAFQGTVQNLTAMIGYIGVGVNTVGAGTLFNQHGLAGYLNLVNNRPDFYPSLGYSYYAAVQFGNGVDSKYADGTVRLGWRG